MVDPESWSLPLSFITFFGSAIVVMIFGRWLAKIADHLADRTGLGEALMGALFLGAATSLPEISTTVTAAVTTHADLAVSTALGGIAVQTVFLSVADITYKRANLEHADEYYAGVAGHRACRHCPSCVHHPSVPLVWDSSRLSPHDWRLLVWASFGLSDTIPTHVATP